MQMVRHVAFNRHINRLTIHSFLVCLECTDSEKTIVIPTAIKPDLIAHLTQLKLVTPVTAILDSQNSSIPFEQGHKYQALVEARLSDGNARVFIAEKLIQMHLPEEFQAGSKLDVIFVSHEPNLKFLISNQALLETDKNNTSISTTGRFLGALMQNVFNHSLPKTTQLITSLTPILDQASINSTELPGLLQKTITQSGLFYESHQAQWINGENTLENLHNEPQNKPMSVTTEISKSIIPASPNTDVLMGTHNISLVLQQLATLETSHLFWRGEVWQNQPMEWDIFEQSENNNKSDFDSATQWQTQIRLSMPELGNIIARISLNASSINIKLATSKLEAASLLRNNQLPLAVDLQSAGLTITAIEVQHDDSK